MSFCVKLYILSFLPFFRHRPLKVWCVSSVSVMVYPDLVQLRRVLWKWHHSVKLAIGWKSVSMVRLKLWLETMDTVLCRKSYQLKSQHVMIWYIQRIRWIFADSMQKLVRLALSTVSVMHRRRQSMVVIYCAAIEATITKSYTKQSTVDACSNGAVKWRVALVLNDVKSTHANKMLHSS